MSRFDASNFLAGFDRADKLVVATAEAALVDFAAQVAGNSSELAPVETGFLKSSATWGAVQNSAEGIFVLVGHNAEYAAAVHERLVHHVSGKTIHHPQGQAKFLETALRDLAPKFSPYIASRVKGAIGG